MVRLVLIMTVGVLLSGACTLEPACPETSPPDPAMTPEPGPLYVSTADVFEPGPLEVRTIHLERCESGAPRPLDIHVPVPPGSYAVLFFQHGFLLSTAYFSDMLTHLASHGFVVVAPQMYPPGGIPFGQPDVAEEADRAEAVLAWMPDYLAYVTGQAVDLSTLGIIGHSRGGKVAWTVVLRDPARFSGVAGVDPVDSELDRTPRVTDQAWEFDLPSLVIGAGLAPGPGSPLAFPCAPVGDNHEVFFAASPSPSWHVIATEQGHLDMLNDETPGCGIICDICVGSGDRGAMRSLTAGLLTAFFRATMLGRSEDYTALSNPVDSPTPVTVETK